MDAAGAATYQTNADAYVKELQALDAWAKAQIATIQQQALQAMQAQVDSSFQTLAASSLQMVNNQSQPQAAGAVTPMAPPIINPIQQAINTVNTSVDAAMLAAQQSVKNAESMVNDPAQQTPGS